MIYFLLLGFTPDCDLRRLIISSQCALMLYILVDLTRRLFITTVSLFHIWHCHLDMLHQRLPAAGHENYPIVMHGRPVFPDWWTWSCSHIQRHCGWPWELPDVKWIEVVAVGQTLRSIFSEAGLQLLNVWSEVKCDTWPACVDRWTCFMFIYTT